MSILGLPYELVSYVVGYLALSDVLSLTLSCKAFRFLLQEPSITKQILEVLDPPQTEYSLLDFADGSTSPRRPTVPRPSKLLGAPETIQPR
jgi:hypothetical protein